jgi:hypothetical protein
LFAKNRDGFSTPAAVRVTWAGKADFQKRGRVTHKGLDYHVAERVKELTGGRQTLLSITPSGIADILLALAGP